MPGKNKNPLLGWHAPAELSAWVRAEAERRGVPLSVILNEAVKAYRAMPQPRMLSDIKLVEMQLNPAHVPPEGTDWGKIVSVRDVPSDSD